MGYADDTMVVVTMDNSISEVFNIWPVQAGLWG